MKQLLLYCDVANRKCPLFCWLPPFPW